SAGRGVLTARYKPAAPAISTAAARRAAGRAQVILGGPVTLRYQGNFVGSLSAGRLASLLRFEPKDGEIAVALDQRGLAQAVTPFVRSRRRQATNARFVIAGASVQVVPSQPGFDVDAAAAASAVLAAASGSAIRIADVPMREVPADLTTGEAESLGIRRQLASFTTEMGPSSSNRIHNVHLMADFIDGTIIRPGQVFSFNKVVGPRTAERGFLEGQEIIGSLVLPSIGGGVCQTATSLFHDASASGLPVPARTAHHLH